MWVFGHLGIGYKMANRYRRDLPLKLLLVGCLLPDLIDKPLYLVMVLITGRHGQEIGLISGTRTFGHTLFFLLILCGVYVFRRTQGLLAIIVGTVTHLFLDFFSKLDLRLSEISFSKAIQYVYAVLLWPLFGPQFPGQDLKTIHAWTDLIPPPLVIVCEIVGLIILIRRAEKP